MRKLTLFLAVVFFALPLCAQNNIYIAQSSAGANSGADCSDGDNAGGSITTTDTLGNIWTKLTLQTSSSGTEQDSYSFATTGGSDNGICTPVVARAGTCPSAANYINPALQGVAGPLVGTVLNVNCRGY